VRGTDDSRGTPHLPSTAIPNSSAGDVDRTFELEVASALAKNRVVDWDFTGRLALTVRYFVPHGWVDDKDKSGVVAKLLLEVKKTLDLPKNYDAEDVDRVHTFLTSEQGSAWCGWYSCHIDLTPFTDLYQWMRGSSLGTKAIRIRKNSTTRPWTRADEKILGPRSSTTL
jgi:hypothetical protein